MPSPSEAVVQRCSVEKVFLEISQNSHENTCARVSSFLIRLQAGLHLSLKRDSGTGVSCEFSEISKNTSFYTTALVAASGPPLQSQMSWTVSCFTFKLFLNKF